MITKLSLLLLLIISPVLCHAQKEYQEKNYIRQFTDENGLPQNSINGIAFDNVGFIWLASQGGLVRFDGQQMVVYSKATLGVDSDRFVKLKRDGRSAILYAVNEYNQLVAIWDGHASRERRYESERALDLATLSENLHIDFSKTTEGNNKYRIITDTPGHYFVYANQKVSFFVGGKLFTSVPFSGDPYFDPFPSEPSVRRNVIEQTKSKICVDNFMVIGGHLFYHLGSEGTQLLRFSENGTTKVGLYGDIVRDPSFRDAGKVRIITNKMTAQAFAVLNKRIYYITYARNSDVLNTRLLVEDFDIDDNLVYRMLFDENNMSLFLGSFSKGLILIQPKAFRVIHNKNQKNFHDVYYSHLPFLESSVIIPDGDILGNDPKRPEDGMGFRMDPPTHRMSMAKDVKGRYWIAKKNYLYRLASNASKQEARWTFDKYPKNIYEGPDGKIWIGFKTGEIAYMEPGAGASDKPITLTKLKSEPTFVYQDKPGRIWLGTQSGLYRYDLSLKKLYAVEGLSRKTVRSIFASTPDQLWITTYGDGIYLLEGGKLTKMPLDEKGYLLHAHYIMPDKQRHFWIPTNKGLFRAAEKDMLAFAHGNIENVFYIYYNRENGFFTNEFNGGCQPCGIELGDGTYSLPSMSGLVWFRPARVPVPNLTAPMVFEHLKMDDTMLPLADTIKLPYNFMRLMFDVKSPFNGSSENLEMNYAVTKKNAVKRSWKRIGSDQHVDIFGLSTGTYHVTVRKIIGFGGRYLDKSLVLVVEQAWFLSWWFIFLVSIALVLLFTVLIKWRLLSLTQRNQMLSRKVEERTKHLTKALNDLKASDDALQMQLHIQMQIIGVINHDLHSPLHYLSKHVPDFLEKITPYLPDTETVRLGSAISKSTVKVYSLADELLKFIKATYNTRGKITYENVSLEDVLERKALFFAEIAKENQTSLFVRCEPGLMVKTNYVMLEILIHNLLDNALKHTYGQEVRISSERDENNNIVITISDTGFGMYADIVDWLNNDSMHGKEGKEIAVPANLGLGLIMVKEIAVLLGLLIFAESSSKGTKIGLRFID